MFFRKKPVPVETKDSVEEGLRDKDKETDNNELHVNMPVLLFDSDGKRLLKGRIEKLDNKLVYIGRSPGDLSLNVFEENTELVFRGYNHAMKPINMSCIVKSSNRIGCVLSDFVPIPYTENRKYYRLPLDVMCNIYVADDYSEKRGERVKLLNISEGGALFLSSMVYSEGDVMKLKVNLHPEFEKLEFKGEIIRVTPVDGNQFEYGMLFAQLDDKDTQVFTSQILRVQSEMRRVGKL